MKRFFNKAINYSDLEMLAKLYAGENTEIHIFDPAGKVNWDLDNEDQSKSYNKRILFNFGGELIRHKELELSDFECIVDFGRKIKTTGFKLARLNAVQAPSGTVRYIYQESNRSFRFLDFIQTPTLRSKVMKFGLKALLKLNQINLVGKRANVLSQHSLHFEKAIQEFSYANYAIFLGTPGFWRKPVIQLQNNTAVSHYVKFALTQQTKTLVHNEMRINRQLKAAKLELIQLPKAITTNNDDIFAQKPFEVKKLKRINQINTPLFMALKEMAVESMKFEKLSKTSFYSEVLDQLYFLKNKGKAEDRKICYLLNFLKDATHQNQYNITTRAHGDFTPWNIYQQKSSFFVYDWEMSIPDAPALYDAFHFIYQTELLVNRKGLEGVRNRLEVFFKEPKVAAFVSQYKIDVTLHHQLYLLHATSKNLMLISKQQNRTEDQKILLEAWEKALVELPLASRETYVRSRFLSDFELFLKHKSYAALKFFLPNFESLPITSDLDLAIDENDLEEIQAFIANHNLVKRHVTVKKSFMSTSQIYFGNGSYLSIDFIHDFIRKGIRYLDIQSVLNIAKLENGVKRPTLFHDIEYAQHFYTLNNASLPLKYQQIFGHLLTENDQKELYLKTLKNKYDLTFNQLTEAFNFSNRKKAGIKKYIKLKHSHLGFVTLQRRVGYLRDLLVDLTQNKGFIVTFSGVDGAGKTTIIKEVKKQFEQKYRKEIVLMRHRPGILPILSAIKHGGVKNAEQKASETIPRQGTNKNKLSSFLRFSYYFADYLFGQFYVYFKYVIRGKIIIYDRYYYDFINDSERSNIRLKRTFIKRLFRFIYKPDYNFYLYNDPEVILERKQELKADDIVDLNSKYASLFNELDAKKNGTYQQIKNDFKTTTVNQIFSTIHKVA